MFWKNKTAAFSIKLLHSNRRNAVRIYPEKDEVCLNILGEEASILNLSSNGVAFTLSEGHAAKHQRQIPATLSLEGSNVSPIHITLELIAVDANIYRCSLDLPERGFNSLCQYLVRHQIDNIRKLKKNKEKARQRQESSI